MVKLGQMTAKRADLMLFALAVVWGSGYSVTKAVIEVLPPIQFLTYRYVISGVLAILFFRKKIMKANKSDWIAGFLIGTLSAAAMLIQTIGLQYTGAGKAVFVASAFVVMVPFFYWAISKQKPQWKIIGASLLMMFGFWLMSMGKGTMSGINKGDVLVLISAAVFAMQTAAIGVFVAGKDPFMLSGIQFISSGIVFLIINSFTSEKQPLPLNIIPALLYSAFIITFVCFIVQIVCQKYTSPSRAAIIINLESVFGSIIAIIFLGERYTPIMILAFAITFLSVMIAEADLKNFRIPKRSL